MIIHVVECCFDKLSVNYFQCEVKMCGSTKYPYPHHRGSLEIPRGRGVLMAKIFKEMYEPKLEFPGGGV